MMPPVIDADLARLSAWIYESAEAFRRRVTDQGWEIGAWHDHAGTQAALVAADGWCALVFRGTQATGKSWRERAIDFGANMRLCPSLWAGPGRAHTGYAAALARVRWPARQMAEDVPSDMPLYVTGHSLGGALATLYAAWAEHRIAGLVTFGAPKVGTEVAVAEITAADIRRYVMPMDFAPHWPPVPGLTHPAEAMRLAAPGWWPGPVSRHAVEGYVAGVSA